MSADIEFIVAQLSSTTTPALTTSYAVRPAYANGSVMLVSKQGLGRTATQTLFASVTRALAGTLTGITLKAQVSYNGANATTASAANWTDVALTDLSDPDPATNTAIEWDVDASAGTTAWLTLGTTNARNAPYFRVLVKAKGGDAGADESATVRVVAS